MPDVPVVTDVGTVALLAAADLGDTVLAHAMRRIVEETPHPADVVVAAFDNSIWDRDPDA